MRDHENETGLFAFADFSSDVMSRRSGVSRASYADDQHRHQRRRSSGYIAALIENKKLDVKYGIKINNMMMDFTEAANAVKLGRTMASSMQPSTAVNLVKSGTDIRLITPQIWSGNSWVVRKDAPYKSFGDLKGKKIGNFARVTGAYFFSAVIAKEQKLDIEKDFQNVPAETGALIALLERGEVEAINMFEPHTTRLVMSGKYRVLTDFDIELENIFGAPPLNRPWVCSRRRWKNSRRWS